MKWLRSKRVCVMKWDEYERLCDEVGGVRESM